MGFKSVMKKIGKVALKVAPIAAAFIPGIGPLASMAIGAASNAASKKISGGSWKDALISGGIGAGAGYLGGKIPGLGGTKGIGPSNAGSYIKDAVSSTASKASGGGGIGSILKNVGMGVGKNMLGGMGGGQQGLVDTQQRGSTLDSILGAGTRIGEAYMNRRTPSSGGLGPSAGSAISRQQQQLMPQGGYDYENDPSNQLNQNNPNLSQYLHQGRQEALKRRPQYAY